MKKFFFISLVFVNANAIAQSVDVARAEFNRYEYERSANIYSKLNESKKLEVDDLKRLAYAQYVNGDFASCLNTVNDLIQANAAESMHYLMRADALKATGSYADAKTAYALYLTKDPSDNVQVDVASCDYLVDAPIMQGASQYSLMYNTRKADSRYNDSALGEIVFHEIGMDSAKVRMDLLPSDDAELMLMRPFLWTNKTEKQIFFPNKFDQCAITSLSKDPNSNVVVFTVVDMLSNKEIDRAPHLYIGTWVEERLEVEDVKPWKFSEFDANGSTAFGAFTPDGSGLIFSCVKSGTSTFSDLYFSQLSEGQWQNPVMLSGVNTDGFEVYPMFKNEAFYFSSTGRIGCGAMDVYSGKFDRFSNAITEIKHLDQPINSFSDDYWPIIANDTIYVSSNRFGSKAEDDVWMVVDNEHIAELIRKKAYMDSLQKEDAVQIIKKWSPKEIYFNFETNQPNTDYLFLDTLTRLLKKNPLIDIEVDGYTDIRGEEDVNMKLSEARANFVIDEMAKRGLPMSRMKAVGKGEERAKLNSTEESSEEVHQSNRLIIIRLIRKDLMTPQ